MPLSVVYAVVSFDGEETPADEGTYTTRALADTHCHAANKDLSSGDPGFCEVVEVEVADTVPVIEVSYTLSMIAGTSATLGGGRTQEVHPHRFVRLNPEHAEVPVRVEHSGRWHRVTGTDRDAVIATFSALVETPAS